MSERIYTRCPACGNDTLIVNSKDHHLLCTWQDCPNPIAAHEAGETITQLRADLAEAAEAFEQLAFSFPAIQVDCKNPVQAAQFINAEYEKLRSELCREQEKLKLADENTVRENTAHLIAENNRKDAVIAEMREVLSKHHEWSVYQSKHNQIVYTGSLRSATEHALSTSSGKDFIHRNKLTLAVAELERVQRFVGPEDWESIERVLLALKVEGK